MYYQSFTNHLIGKNSYVDAWPFNVFDFLNSDRLRVQEFHLRIKTIGLTSSRHFNIWNLHIKPSFTYEHYFFSGNLNYGRRYYIVFPIFTDYNNYQTDLESNLDASVKLNYCDKLSI